MLEKIRRKVEAALPGGGSGLIQSIGDDCAVMPLPGGRLGLLTTDISVESVHFKREYSTPADIGYKAMMGNISDIASMGGRALYALVSLGIPHEEEEEYALGIYDGLLEAASAAGVEVAGGDLSRSPHVVVNIALYGDVDENGIVYRKGAREGDFIYVTGHLGNSRAGLELLSEGAPAEGEYSVLVNGHRRPTARHDIVRDIIAQFSPTSMIDVSDGLLSDLGHLCGAGSVGFSLLSEKIPVTKALDRYARERGRNPLEYALESGEEYELLFTSQKQLATTMSLTINDIPVTFIGEIIREGYHLLDSGKINEISVKGYDHFKTSH